MRKFTFTLFILFCCSSVWSQQQNFWTPVNESLLGRDLFEISRSQRPPAYKIFQLSHSFFQRIDLAPSERIVSARNSFFIMSFPTEEGVMERFRIVEAPVMHPALAAKYPGISSYAGVGIDDPTATIRFDVSPQGIHAIILSSKRSSIYIDPLDQNYYRVVARKDIINYRSHFNCTTEPALSPVTSNGMVVENADDGKLRIYRLAMISGAEFSQHFLNGTEVTLVDSVTKVIIAQNSHVTRSNAVYERDFGVRMELVANNDLLVYFFPGSDPIANPNSPSGTTMNNTIDNTIGQANYDIGHTESKGNDNGNAGCIGCVCINGSKGRGWTVYSNPSLLEFFVIDYLTHEMGHQFGANHTFSHNTEGTGVNVEPGSGSTIMGYAGITGGNDVQPHSDEFFHSVSIEQVTNYIKNPPGSSCAQEIITGNTAPVANAGADYTIPRSTPFKLTGTGSDVDAADVLTYNWEQIDTRTSGPSQPNPTSTTGPMFRAYLPTTSPSRTFPQLQHILSGANGFQWEQLPSVGRNLNFRFIVKDNHVGGGNNKSDDMRVTVSGTSGPFGVSSPNTNVSWDANSTQTVTWTVNGSDLPPVSCANVNILLSIDGGLSFPITLASNTPNDGTHNVVIPNNVGTTNRIKVESVGNVFFDISNTNFTISTPPVGFEFTSPAAATSACPAGASMAITLGTISNGGFTTAINLSATGNPIGTTVSFSPNPVTPGNNTIVTLTGTNILAAGSYPITVTGIAGPETRTRILTYTITASAGPAITSQPSNQGVCVGTNASFTVVSAGATGFQWQLSTDGGVNYTNISNAGVYSGATTATLSIAGATLTMNGYRYRAIASIPCGTTTSTDGILTVNTSPVITTQPQSITLCAASNHTFTVAASGNGLSYQWELSTDGGANYSPVTNGGIYSGATTAGLTLTGITVGLNNNRYRVVVTGSCAPAATSSAAVLTVVTSVAITTQPVNMAVCVGGNTSFTVAGSGSGIIYQWQVSTDGGANFTNLTNSGVYSGTTTATLVITGATFSLNGYVYRAQLSNSTCTTPGVSNTATLTVNTLPNISSNPQNATICVGGNTTFTAAATGTGIAYQWQLSTDGNTWNDIVGATTASYSVTGATSSMNNYQYRVLVTGICPPAATSTAALLTVISPVTISTPNQPVNSEICSGSNASFVVTGTSTQPITYAWELSTDGGNTYNPISNTGVYSGTNTNSLVITNAGMSLNSNLYRVKVSNTTCTAPTTSNAAALTVRQLPTVTLTASPLTSLLPGQTTTLTAVPTASTGGVLSTTWSYNGTTIPNTGNSYLVDVEHVGDYKVMIQELWPSSLACTSESAIVKIEASTSTRLFIYPSPNNGQFTVAYYNAGGGSTKRTVTIFDSHGSKVYSNRFDVTGSYTLLPINLAVARGVYHIVIGDVDGKRIAKGNVVVH